MLFKYISMHCIPANSMQVVKPSKSNLNWNETKIERFQDTFWKRLQFKSARADAFALSFSVDKIKLKISWTRKPLACTSYNRIQKVTIAEKHVKRLEKCLSILKYWYFISPQAATILASYTCMHHGELEKCQRATLEVWSPTWNLWVNTQLKCYALSHRHG